LFTVSSTKFFIKSLTAGTASEPLQDFSMTLLLRTHAGIAFRWKDYRINGPGRWKTMRLDPHEFIRRFLLHVLPKGFANLVMADTELRGRIAQRQPFAILLGGSVAVDTAHTAERADTVRRPGLALAGRHSHSVQ
jgi:hypothetical protein